MIESETETKPKPRARGRHLTMTIPMVSINCTAYDRVSSLSIVSHDAADLTNSYQLVYVLAWHGKDLLPYLLPRECFHFLPF